MLPWQPTPTAGIVCYMYAVSLTEKHLHWYAVWLSFGWQCVCVSAALLQCGTTFLKKNFWMIQLLLFKWHVITIMIMSNTAVRIMQKNLTPIHNELMLILLLFYRCHGGVFVRVVFFLNFDSTILFWQHNRAATKCVMLSAHGAFFVSLATNDFPICSSVSMSPLHASFHILSCIAAKIFFSQCTYIYI